MDIRRKTSRQAILITIAVVMVALCSSLYGQSERARIIGTVTDPQGAVVPGATVTVTNVATGVATRTNTDSQGAYQALELSIGEYKVKVARSGFKTTETVAYKIEINQVLRVDVRLPIGATSEIVEVTGTATTIDTVNATMGSTVPETEIHNAPLNGRNALDLALLQPGVLPADNPGNGGAFSANTAFSISGGRNDSNTFVLDGNLNNDLLDNGVVYNPNPDAIQEFKVLTSNFSAEYGRNAGGIVTVVTKSGTNDFHGTAFEYNRNTDYNANDYIDNSLGLPRPILKRNQYGGTVGGPILKNKLFFFLAYQGQRQTQIITSGVASVPTAQELQGNFSASPNQASVAAFLQANPFFQANPALAAQGIIDPTKIDPVAQKYINASLVPISPTGVTSFQNPAQDNRDEITGKFDWEATSSDHISLTLGRTQNPNFGLGLGTAGVGAFSQPAPGEFVSGGNTHTQFFNVTYIRTISSGMLNEVHVGAQRAAILQSSPNQSLGTPQSFGTTITPDNPTGPPLLTFPGLSLGFSPQGPTTITDNTFTYSDTFSWTRGKHNLKFGAAFSAFQNNTLFDFFVNGNFDFVPSIGNGPFGAGDAFANFLLGIPDFLFQAPAAPSNVRSKATSIFGQDEWHVSHNLVLTFGLRWEYSTPKLDTQGRSFSVVPGAQSTVFPNAPVGILFPGDKGAPTGSNFPDKSNFAPRFGFAWQPFHDGKTSIRGGFGVFYDILKGEDNLQFNGQFPFAATAFIGFNDPTGTPAPFGLLTDPFGSTGSPNPFPSGPINHNISFVNNVGTFGGAGVFFVDPNLQTPYTYQYNLSLEHEVARKMTFTMAYVGSSSHGLTGLKDVNPCDLTTSSPGNCDRILNETPGNTFTSLGFLPQFMNVANANYNALQLSLRQRQASVPVLGSMYYTLGYTWAHSLDDASGFRNNSSQVPFYQPHLFYASSDYDLRQVLTFSGGWDLPFNKGPRRLVKGWSLYPILSFRTGFPFTVTAGLPTLDFDPGPSGAGDGALVNANLASPIQYIRSHSTGQFFNPNSFNDNVVSGYGTAPRNGFNGPGRTNLDLSLSKVTPLYGDRLSLRLSVDAFNLFNHTEFQSLGTNAADATTLGQVLSVYPQRILQLAAHVNF